LCRDLDGGKGAKIASAATVAAVERIARSDRHHARRAEDFDADPWSLNTPAGVVDLRTGETRKHRRDDLHTKVTAVAPGGPCPRWLRFLLQISQGDKALVRYLQRFIGYTLTGSTREHVFVFLRGPGGNGKGVLMSTVAAVLGDYARSLVGEIHAPSLVEAWSAFEEALGGQPLVGLYCAFGFCWQRTWDRPFVPDIEAVPAADRDYYERHGCFQHNNPGLNDLGKDVLFDLITRESGAKMAADIDRSVIAPLHALIARLNLQLQNLSATPAIVFTDLRDRVRAYLHWVTSLRSVCAWCECVYGYLEATNEATRKACEQKLQQAIDLELGNIRGLIELLENTPSEVLVVSNVAETTFFYGENLVEHLKTKLRLTAQYRHHPPRVDRNIFWRPIPGTVWPDGWSAEGKV